MSTTTEHSELTELDRGRGYVIITAESTSEVLAGAAVIVVAILGLAGLAPIHMMSTGVIALGAAFLLEGAVNLTETWGDVPVGGDTTTKRVSLTNDVSAELLAGVAGGVLGILALIGVVPQILSACAILLFGACLLVSDRLVARTRETFVECTEKPGAIEVRPQTGTNSGPRPLVALVVIVLGLMATVNIAPMPLTFVGLIVSGAFFAVRWPATAPDWSQGLRWTH